LILIILSLILNIILIYINNTFSLSLSLSFFTQLLKFLGNHIIYAFAFAGPRGVNFLLMLIGLRLVFNARWPNCWSFYYIWIFWTSWTIFLIIWWPRPSIILRNYLLNLIIIKISIIFILLRNLRLLFGFFNFPCWFDHKNFLRLIMTIFIWFWQSSCNIL